jgi:type I restriction enzyme, S subunit
MVPIEEGEIPFEVPKGWRWVRLGDVATMKSGGTPNDFNVSKMGRYPFVKVGDMNLKENNVEIKTSNQFTDLYFPNDLIENFSIIFPKRGGAIATNKKRIVNQPIYIDTNTMAVTPIIKDIFKYLKIWFDKFDLWELNSGTAVPQINNKDIEPLLFLAPPLAEQHRIVQKIESLIFQIDKLEESLQNKQHLMGQLPKAVVDAIGSCQTGEEFKEKLQFVVENFETVFQTPESMQDLRNVILQLAIEGKLVPQDSSDESASELLKRIQAERERLVKEGKIKKQKAMAPIEEDEVPFEVPESWEWVRLEVLSDINPRNIIDDNLDVSFIPMKLMDDGYGSSHRSEIKKWKELKSGYTHFAENDIAIAKITPCFENRKSAILTNLESGFGAGTTEFHIIRVFSDLVSRQYILSIFKTQWVIKAGTNTFTGTAGQQRVSTDFIKEFAIPLPPLAEQHRIVQKVESLMCLIDEMENKLKLKSDLVEKMADV